MRPALVIGVAGRSGSGKTAVVRERGEDRPVLLAAARRPHG